jgi:death on curing protein
LTIRYLTEKQVLRIHHFIMELHGDEDQAGVMFPDRLAAAIERPQQMIFGEEIHPTLEQKAGALVQSLIQTHPFYNGNKRTALMCLDTFLQMNGYFLKTSTAVDLMVQFATEERFKGDSGDEEIRKVIGEYIVLLN